MEPIVLESGDHAKKSLAQLMFTDYSWLRGWLEIIRRGHDQDVPAQSPTHARLEWLMEHGQDRVAVVNCVHQDSRGKCMAPATHIEVSFRSGNDPGIIQNHVYCSQHAPEDSPDGTTFVPLRFSTLERYHGSVYQMFLSALRSTLGAPDTLTREACLAFFEQKPTASVSTASQ